jgi:hypothetical protein
MGTFLRWAEEYEAAMGQSPATASDEVMRTNLQPQVGTEKIAKNSADLDSLLAIDGQIQQFDASIQSALRDDSESAQQFKNLWDDLSTKWKEFKEKKKSNTDNSDYGLGSNGGDEGYRQAMYDHPNSIPPQGQATAGPGMMGN